MSERIALHVMGADDLGLPSYGPVQANDYSRFKHGDGRIAIDYGRALADRFLEVVPLTTGAVAVTSSGYAAVPPAARALVRPFLQRLHERAPELSATAFRMHRLGVSPGDYATMDPAARSQAVSAKSMQIDPRVDLRGVRVVALDDIRVTGTHEAAMDGCLNAAGASWIDHLYLVDAHLCAVRPEVESTLNSAWVRTVDHVLDVACAPGFEPNARFAKRIALMSREDQERFARLAPLYAVLWVTEAMLADGLDHVAAYATGVRRFRQALADVQRLSQPA
ncbi:phosphoribosyltransferase family protein [Calidifontibacter terrae]